MVLAKYSWFKWRDPLGNVSKDSNVASVETCYGPLVGDLEDATQKGTTWGSSGSWLNSYHHHVVP